MREFLLGLLVATGVWAQMPAPPAGAAGYYRMKMARIVDEQGFGQPVEVARLLIPADWQAQGGVRWDQSQLRCPANIIKIQFRALAPDGVSAVEFLPAYVWTAASDPMMMQTLQRAAVAGQGCDVGPVTNAAGFLQRMVIPRMRPGARVTGAEPLPAVTQAKQMAMAQTYGPMVQAGLIRGFQADAGAVRIEYMQGGQAVQEWMSASVTNVASASANTAALMQGQVNMSASSFTLMSEGVFSLRMPAGRFDNKLAATIIASVRPNPQYAAAVSQFLTNMGNIQLRGTMDRARIWHEAGQQISATITQSYQQQQAVQDRTAANFSQSIRGVETFVHPTTGQRVELTGGYGNAWVNNRGEYLLSDSPGFNPAVALREDWTQLRRAGPR